jgi:hypothetical protein
MQHDFIRGGVTIVNPFVQPRHALLDDPTRLTDSPQ